MKKKFSFLVRRVTSIEFMTCMLIVCMLFVVITAVAGYVLPLRAVSAPFYCEAEIVTEDEIVLRSTEAVRYSPYYGGGFIPGYGQETVGRRRIVLDEETLIPPPEKLREGGIYLVQEMGRGLPWSRRHSFRIIEGEGEK